MGKLRTIAKEIAETVIEDVIKTSEKASENPIYNSDQQAAYRNFAENARNLKHIVSDKYKTENEEIDEDYIKEDVYEKSSNSTIENITEKSLEFNDILYLYGDRYLDYRIKEQYSAIMPIEKVLEIDGFGFIPIGHVTKGFFKINDKIIVAHKEFNNFIVDQYSIVSNIACNGENKTITVPDKTNAILLNNIYSNSRLINKYLLKKELVEYHKYLFAMPVDKVIEIDKYGIVAVGMIKFGKLHINDKIIIARLVKGNFIPDKISFVVKIAIGPNEFSSTQIDSINAILLKNISSRSEIINKWLIISR